MIIKESPVFLLSSFDELLTQLHAVLAIIIVFGDETAFHLGKLWRHIAAKEDLFSIHFDQKNLVIRAMAARELVVNIPIEGTGPIHKHNIIALLQEPDLFCMVRLAILFNGILHFSFVYIISGMRKAQRSHARDCVDHTNTTRMVFVQMAHEHFRNVHRIDMVINQVLMQLQNAIAVFKTKTCI